jgi:hypothetical protein
MNWATGGALAGVPVFASPVEVTLTLLYNQLTLHAWTDL